MKKIGRIIAFLVSFLIVYAVAFIGSIFTSKSVKSEWYLSIKPSLTPPDFIFPIVWSLLFFLIALTLALSWLNSKRKMRKEIVLVFGINFLINILWTLFYFGMKNPMLAFFDIIVLLISIAFMIFSVRKVNKKLSWLLLPYLLWVCFAAVLNWMSF